MDSFQESAVGAERRDLVQHERPHFRNDRGGSRQLQAQDRRRDDVDPLRFDPYRDREPELESKRVVANVAGPPPSTRQQGDPP